MSNPEHLRICVNCDKGWIEHVRDEACGEYLPVCGAVMTDTRIACSRPRGHDGRHRGTGPGALYTWQSVSREQDVRPLQVTASDAAPSDPRGRESGR